jgi:hypothetical protein
MITRSSWNNATRQARRARFPGAAEDAFLWIWLKIQMLPRGEVRV